MAVLVQPQLLLEGNLILYLLLPEIAHRVIAGNVLVCLRIVLIVVNAVDNT